MKKLVYCCVRGGIRSGPAPAFLFIYFKMNSIKSKKYFTQKYKQMQQNAQKCTNIYEDMIKYFVHNDKVQEIGLNGVDKI